MKIVSWNVNGIKSRIRNGFFDFLEASYIDILCVQELKITDEQTLPLGLIPPEFETFWSICKYVPAYSGTAVFTRIPPYNITLGLGNEDIDAECRCIILDMNTFFLINVYIPNAQHKLSRIDVRREFDELFSKKISELHAIKPVIICGDFNCTLTDDDKRKTLPRTKSITLSESTRFNVLSMMRCNSLVDVFRFLHPEASEQYTWWSSRGQKRKENIGWRIDYFLASESLLESISACGMYQDVYGSDHCPIYLELCDEQNPA